MPGIGVLLLGRRPNIAMSMAAFGVSSGSVAGVAPLSQLLQKPVVAASR
jgi:hypothetical protein